jgi:O-antigen/teichoic acid export membrane protein
MKRLTKNVIAITGSDMTRKFFGFLTIACLTRHVSVSDFGLINIGLTILSYVLIFGAAGIPTYATREIARSIDPSFIGRVISTRLMLTIGLIMLFGIGIFFFIHDIFVASFFILFTLAALPNAFFLDWYFQGKESMSSIGAARGLAAVVNFLLIFFFVKSSHDILWVAGAAIIGDLCASILYLYSAKQQHVTILFQTKVSDSFGLLKQAFPLGLSSILVHASVNLSPLLLGVMLSTHSVGIFSAANKLVFFLMFFDRLLATLLLPASSRIFSQQPEQLKQRLEETLKWVLLIALPLCVGGTMLSNDLIRFIFGEAYSTSSHLFSILVWFLLMTMLHTVYGSGLVAIGKEKLFAKLMAVSALVYFSLMIACTYFFHETGAAYAMVFSEGITVLLSGFALRNEIKISFPSNTLKIFLTIVFMAVLLLLLPELHFLFKILLGAFVYSAILFTLKAVRWNEVQQMFRRVW